MEIEERLDPAETPLEHVRRLARGKAEAARPRGGEIVLGADTVVVAGDEVLGKPADAADAARMLRLLSGRPHRVLTGICLLASGVSVVDAENTWVHFAPLTAEEIDAYVATGEPMDKAGGYAIQGLASKFVQRIEGCYSNVVGLPVALVYGHLKRIWADRGTSASGDPNSPGSGPG